MRTMQTVGETASQPQQNAPARRPQAARLLTHDSDSCPACGRPKRSQTFGLLYGALAAGLTAVVLLAALGVFEGVRGLIWGASVAGYGGAVAGHLIGRVLVRRRDTGRVQCVCNPNRWLYR